MKHAKLRWDDLSGDDVCGVMGLLRVIRQADPGSRLSIRAGTADERHLKTLHSLGLLAAVPSGRAGVSSFQFQPREKGTLA